MTLLSSSAGKLAALEGFGLSVIARQPLVDFEPDVDSGVLAT
jgi:GTP cyclohydrolase II